jgi:hypothetical protein
MADLPHPDAELLELAAKRNHLRNGAADIAVAVHDPLLELVQEYRQQMAINNSAEVDLDQEDALAQETFRPSYDRLRTSPPAATSYKGALDAIRLVIDEEETCGNQPDLTINVLRAALAFLDRQA